MDSQKRIALFDMDNTLFDLKNRMKEELEKMKGPSEASIDDPFEDTPHLNARRHVIKRVPGFWRSLPRYQPGWDIMDMARSIGFDIHILTKGPNKLGLAWMEKMECIHDHFGDEVTLHISEDKSVTYGRVLVDDYPNYLEPWLKHRHRGLAIMPAHSYNKEFKHPNVIRYKKNIKEVKKALQCAFDRKPKTHWKDLIK